MRCIECDGTGRLDWEPWKPIGDSPCQACGGTGVGSDDDFERKLREAVAKIGMVYFVRDDANGRIKISTALNPLARLRDLQTGSSVPLRLLGMYPGGREAEQSAHQTWASRRLAGEWFDDRDREISRILLWVVRTSSTGIVWPNP
jgi:hypothetical protein